jgi:hypothetical protein
MARKVEKMDTVAEAQTCFMTVISQLTGCP